MCVCVGARDDTYWGGKRSIALTAMGIFFSSERLVVALDNKTLKMEREGDSSSRKGRMQYVVETISVLHSTAQYSIA